MYDCVQLPHRLSFHSQKAPNLPVNVSCKAIRVMNFRIECGPHVAKDSRTELDFISVKWLDGHQLWIWSDLRPALFWDIPQHILVFFSSWIFWPLKTGPIGCPETSARNYHDTLRSISEERKSRLLRSGSLKSRTEATWKKQLMVWLKALIRKRYGKVHPEDSVSGLQFDSGTSHREVRSVTVLLEADCSFCSWTAVHVSKRFVLWPETWCRKEPYARTLLYIR
jgi:hypothetical protein